MNDFSRRPMKIGEILRAMGLEPDVAVEAAAKGQDAKRAYADYLRDNQTTSERLMARVLYHLGCDVEPQQLVLGYIVDFLDREKKVVIEVDGSSHEGKQGYDNDRDEAMRAAGYRVIRVDWWEVPHMLQQVARERAA